MTETTHLGLPYLAAAQAQKHVTHNEALTRLDAVVQLAVIDTTLTAPPGSPGEGDRYIVAAGATGGGQGTRARSPPSSTAPGSSSRRRPGWIAFDEAAEAVLVRHDGDWVALGSFLGAVDRFGVNATADATNRLAVRSNAVLFTGVEAAEGGTGDVRFVVSKEADGDTASLLFQSGFSGRAEVGLAGDTDFVFKVSPDGSAWTEFDPDRQGYRTRRHPLRQYRLGARGDHRAGCGRRAEHRKGVRGGRSREALGEPGLLRPHRRFGQQ